MGEDGLLEGQVGEGEAWEEQSDWDQARRLRLRGSDFLCQEFPLCRWKQAWLGGWFHSCKNNSNTLSSLK